jgi:hypothetical protein
MTSNGTVAVGLGSTQARLGRREPGEGAMGSQYPGNHWSDEQLDAILSEPATWTVNGRNGQVFCTVSSLRQAMDRAASLVALGSVVTALCRMPGNNIIVFEAQTARLRKLCAGREVALFKEMDFRQDDRRRWR